MLTLCGIAIVAAGFAAGLAVSAPGRAFTQNRSVGTIALMRLLAFPR